MSTRPCPTCGSALTDQARFCGQCGTTITAAHVDVHEEVTVAREKPDLSMFKTIIDPPAGAAQLPAEAGGAPAAGIPTPVVPAPETQAAPVVVRPAAGVPNVAKTLLLSQTMNDPEAEARARKMLDAALGAAATSAQAPAAAPKANLHKTMMMGGDSAAAAAIAANAAANAASKSDHPTAPTPVGTGGAPAAVVAEAPPPAPEHHNPRSADASPLSKSVLAPHSWQSPGSTPPAAGQAPSSPPEAAHQAAAAPAPAPAGAGAGAGAPALRTMLGMPATDLGLPPTGPMGLGGTMPLQGGGAGGAGGGAGGGGGAPHPVQKTMLGVAIPGIAPTHASDPDARDARAAGGAAPEQGTPASMQSAAGLASKQSTMLGVAIPGIAPTHASGPAQGPAPHGQQQPPQYQAPRMPSQVQNTALGVMAPPELKIVPRPKTLINEPLPEAPQIPQKKGISALAVVGILILIVAVAGGGIAIVALRSGGALTAIPQLDENGRESLKIGCPTCPDGTTVALGASSATVTGSAAVLPLPAPLSIGENDLGVKIERPAGGRHEEVKVHVPVAYRVRADLSTLSAKPPAITVRVEATVGSTVSVDGKPLTLDGTGRGSYAIDLAKETEGTGDAKPFERKIPFVITPKGGKEETGQLTARTSVIPLALDAPGHELITDKGTAAVAGQTRAGTIVTIDGQAVPVDAAGRFGVRVELSAVGEKPLEIVASAPPLAPRIVKVKVTRVASLPEAAKAEDAQSPATFDAFGADPATKVGQKVVVEGDVVDARVAAGHSVLLIDEKKKCAKGASCLVRVVHGDEDRVARGDIVRAYGKILGSVTASGKTVPDIEGSLVLTIKAAK